MQIPLARVPEQIQCLASEGKSRSVSWSLAQIADHLAMTIEWQLDRLPVGKLPDRLPPMWLRRIFRVIFLGLGRLPRGVPAVSSIVPQSDVDLEASLDRLRSAIASMFVSDGPYRTHPFFGNMTKSGWVRFHEVHAAHHLKRIV
ncbi:MAG: DUF1569 domain-containing protein [Phycisphaerae bacterium]|nr:DUF1569 domain-containing protein [Phycisphaerae bacterium]